MLLTVGEWDNRLHQVLVIKHEYDTEWLLVALEEKER